jgi:holo-[acyl-carrier protein] synthase
MHIYQGIDLVEMNKFRAVFAERTALLVEIFSEREREYCYAHNDPLLHLAARFACKEAAIKALGVGFYGFGVTHIFQEIEIVASASGKPGLSFHGWVAKISRKRRIEQNTVSISHAGDYCVASVILIGG